MILRVDFINGSTCLSPIIIIPVCSTQNPKWKSYITFLSTECILFRPAYLCPASWFLSWSGWCGSLYPPFLFLLRLLFIFSIFFCLFLLLRLFSFASFFLSCLFSTSFFPIIFRQTPITRTDPDRPEYCASPFWESYFIKLFDAGLQCKFIRTF